MTINTKILPAHILRLYVWELLRLNTGVTTIDIDGGHIIPVIPIEDEPKVSDANKAYLVYGYAENESERTKQINKGVFMLKVKAPTFAQLGEINNTLTIAFEDESEASEAVNMWSSTNSALCGIRFTSCCVSYIDGGDPSISEGGQVDSVISINYSYVSNATVQRPIADQGLWS